MAEDDRVEDVNVVWSGLEAHLGVGEVENEVLALVPDVVALKTEEGGKPVDKVHVGEPLGERRQPEVSDGAYSDGGCAYLRESKGRVVSEEVVYGDYVVDFFFLVGGGGGFVLAWAVRTGSRWWTLA